MRTQLSTGADIHQVDANGENALMKAALHGRTESIAFLIDSGADPNRGTRFGTPLHYAAIGGSVPAARLLLQRGAVPSEQEVVDAARFSTPVAEELRKALRGERAPAAPAAASPAPVPAPKSSDVDQPRYASPEREDDFALVIGIQDYDSLPPATHAARDAESVRRHLKALGVPERNIVSLSDRKATRSQLAAYLEEWLPRNVKPESRVFVYYSGHGAPDPKTGQAFLVPSDGDPMFLQSTAYPVRQLYAALGKLKSKKVLVALDACFSGAGGRSVLAQGARPLVTKIEDAAPVSGVTVLAAASGDEITGALDAQAHGMFTYFLLKGLNEGRRGARELQDYLKPRVQDEARRQNREQTPSMFGPDLKL